jgi:hypothetical protein
MSSLMRTFVLVVWPHGGQRGSRANALVAVRDVRATRAEQAAAAHAFDRPERRPVREAVSR